MKSFLVFDDVENPGKTTRIVLVKSESSGFVLGSIKWYGAWRQYCFYPTNDTLWSVGCLNDVNEKISMMMKAWKADLLIKKMHKSTF